ncbi:hypothetical protein HDU89_008534 [Geranomyces variabilis]|nr:hypothetical protein HDU89_008534 [Geranomyces variabilis]
MNTLPSIHSLQAGPPATTPYDLHQQQQQQHLAPFHNTNGVGAHSRRKSFDFGGHGRKSPLPHEYRQQHQQLMRNGGGENEREQLRHQQRHHLHHHNGAPAMYKASPPVTPASDSIAGEPPSGYKSPYPSSYAIPESSSQHQHSRQQQEQQYYYQQHHQQQQQQGHYQNHSLSNGYPHSAPSRSMMLTDERHGHVDLEMEQQQRRQYQHQQQQQQQQQQYHEQHGHPQRHMLREEEMATSAPVAVPTSSRKAGASPASSSKSLAVPNDRPAGRRRSHAFATAKESNRSASASNSRKRSTSFSEDNNGTGSTNGGKAVYECPTCHKSYKHANCLHKHKWEHTEYWAFAAQFSMSKHQQVQLLEAASILVTLGQNKKNVDGMTPTPAPAPQAQPQQRPEMMMMLGDAAAAVSAAAANAAGRGGGDFGARDDRMDADEYTTAVSVVPTPVPPRRIKREKSRRRSSATASREVVA